MPALGLGTSDDSRDISVTRIQESRQHPKSGESGESLPNPGQDLARNFLPVPLEFFRRKFGTRDYCIIFVKMEIASRISVKPFHARCVPSDGGGSYSKGIVLQS